LGDIVTLCVSCINYLVLIIRPNKTIQLQYNSLLLHTTTRFGCPYQPSSGRCWVRKKYIGTDAALYIRFVYPIHLMMADLDSRNM